MSEQEYLDRLEAGGHTPEERKILLRFAKSFSVGKKGGLQFDVPVRADFTDPEVVEYYEQRIATHRATAPVVALHPCAKARSTAGRKTIRNSVSHTFAAAFNRWEPEAPTPFSGPLIHRMIVSEPLALIRYDDGPPIEGRLPLDGLGAPNTHPFYNYPPPLLWANSPRRKRDRMLFAERIAAWLQAQEAPKLYIWSGNSGKAHHPRVLLSAWCLDVPLLVAMPARGSRDIARQAHALRHIVEKVVGLETSEPWNPDWAPAVRWFVIRTHHKKEDPTIEDLSRLEVSVTMFEDVMRGIWYRCRTHTPSRGGLLPMMPSFIPP